MTKTQIEQVVEDICDHMSSDHDSYLAYCIRRAIRKATKRRRKK